ncbi:UNVERIFIED_CONTAM: hypothetical protein GTU68_037657 [Idotea baltica]|nr:hypothetical protein [Idotea baltica]
MPLLGTDYIEFYVSNSKQAAHFYKTAMGFNDLAYSGLETGNKATESYVVVQDKIKLVLTSPLKGNTEIGRQIDNHGDGVKTIALWVEDASKAYEEAITRGAKSFFEPMIEKDSFGQGLKYVDHMVGNVEEGQMNDWVKFYEEVLGFKQILSFDDKDISTEFTALMSKVMSNGNGRIKFPINEPAPGLKKSQVDEYLEFYNGAGVQHIAVATDDIIKTVTQLKSRGIEFLQVPNTYYEVLSDRVGKIDEDIASLSKLGILVDRDEEGYLLQIFTKTVQARPTMFFEIIQRKGANSFGKGNFKALFEALEREQELRGTL